MARKRQSARKTRAAARSAQAAADGSKRSFWDRLTRRRQHIACLGALFLAAVIFFAPFHLDGRTFLGHDVIQWRAGAQSIIEDREAYGEEPLWATNMFAGMPMYVISHVRQFPNVDNVILPALEFMYPIAQYWILMAGAYVLFILLGFRPLSAVIGALIVAFTTYIPIIVGAGHNTKFWAYAYMPWVFVGFTLVTRYPRLRWWGAALFMLAASLHLRQSHPQVTYYFLYLLAAWWILDVVRAVRTGTAREYFGSTGLLAVAGFIAVMTIVQPYWAIMEYSPYSIRGGSEIEATEGLDIDYAFVWSQGWGELLTLAVPNLYGGAEAYWGPKPMTSGPHYFGAIALLLFVVGLIRGRHHLKWLFFGIGTLTLLFSLGKHLPALNETMFYLMPGFDKFRTPEMWLIVTVFCYTLVALTGVEWIFERVPEAGGTRTLRDLYLPAGIVLGFAVVMAAGASTLLSFEREGEREVIARQISVQFGVPEDDPRVVQTAEEYIREDLTPERVDKATTDSRRFLLFAALGAGVLALGVLGKIPIALSVMGLAVLAAADLMTIGARYIGEQSLVPRGTTPAQVIETFRRPLDTFIEERVETDEGWPYRVFPILDNPFNNAIPAYFYPSIGGYTGAKMGTYQDMIDRALFTGDFGVNLPLLNMLNVRYVTHTQALPFPGFEAVFEGERGVVMENRNVLPKAFFVDSLVTVQTPEEALAFISEPFDAGEVAVVETTQPVTAAPDETAEARVSTYRPRLIEIETSRAEDGFLVLSEIYYPPGWRAFVNGEEVPIHKANYILRGVEVPAGRHSVRFEFNPPSYTIGHPISVSAKVLMWLLIIAVGAVTIRRRGAVAREDGRAVAHSRAE